MKNNAIQWDTTKNMNFFPSKIKPVFNGYYLGERKNYSNWVGVLSKNFFNDLDWWISPPASRNLYSTDIYKNICILKTIKKLSKKKYKIELTVETYELKEVIERNFSEKKIIVFLKKNRKLLTRFLYPFYIIKNIFLFLFQFFLAKFLLSKKKFVIKQNILIDTFIIESFLKEKIYYGDIYKYAKKEKKKILFIPTIIQNNILKYYKIIKSLESDNKFFLKERLTDINDLKFCFFYLFRKKKFFTKYEKYENFDLSKIIINEIDLNRDLFSIFLSLYNYCFIKKLKKNSLKFSTVINWFENQSMDKSWNFSFRKFFPGIKTIGYQGFTHYPEYMNTIPTYCEYKSKIIPEKIVVLNKNYKNLRKEFCKKLNIASGPALRSNDLFNSKKNVKKKFNIVLFLEGALKEIDREIILKFIRISKYFPNLKFYIKAHPVLPLKKLNLNLPENFIELYGNFSSIASKTIISVSYGNTSATLESLAYGCKLILPFDNVYDRESLSKLKIDKNLYKICSNDQMLINAIKYFSQENRVNFFKNKKIKSFLFNKVTKRNLRSLI